MNRFLTTVLAVATWALPSAIPAYAHDYRLGDLQIADPWSRATPPGARVGGGYLKVENKGSTPDRLLSVRMAQAGRVEIHEMSITDVVMRMRELSTGVVIAPGATVELKPSGLHVMFMDLAAPLKQGDRHGGSLTFERAGTVAVEFAVEAIGAGRAAVDHAH